MPAPRFFKCICQDGKHVHVSLVTESVQTPTANVTEPDSFWFSGSIPNPGHFDGSLG